MSDRSNGGEEPTHQPARVVAGHCPWCLRVVVVFNNYECWPAVVCECGWKGPTFAIANHTRLDSIARTKQGGPTGD